MFGTIRVGVLAGLATAAISLASVDHAAAQRSEQAPKTVCVLGASGNIGNGVVRELLAAGYRVVAVSRSADNLAAIRTRFTGDGALETLQGGVATDVQGAALRDALVSRFGRVDGVVAALGAAEWNEPRRLLETTADALGRALADNFTVHFIAAKSLLPVLAPGGTYVSISGGLADFVGPTTGILSVTQAAQRTLFEALAVETKGQDVHVHVLGLYSRIATERNRDTAEADWVTDQQVGQHVLEMMEHPESFSETLQSLRSARYR